MWQFFVADSTEPFDELVLVKPGEVADDAFRELKPPSEQVYTDFARNRKVSAGHWSNDMEPDIREVFYDGYKAAYHKDHPGQLPSWMNPYRKQNWTL